MTTINLRGPVRWHRPLLVFAAVMALLAVFSVGGLLFDDRIILDQPIWLKPFKFAVSFALYALALAWMLTFVRRGRRVANVAGTVVAVSGLAEVGLIATQAGRGTRSHFNVGTDFDDAIWQWMGISIGVLYAATLVLAVVLFFLKLDDRVSQWAIRLGVVMALVGMGVGLLMLRPNPAQEAAIDADMETVVGAHSVGVEDGGPAVPLTGWSTTGGDLRIGHFVGIHGLQLLPLFALALAALARRPRFAARLDTARRLRLLVVFAAGYAGVVALVTWQALRAQPLIHPDAVTGLVAGVLVVAVAGAASLVLRGQIRAGLPAPEQPDSTVDVPVRRSRAN